MDTYSDYSTSPHKKQDRKTYSAYLLRWNRPAASTEATTDVPRKSPPNIHTCKHRRELTSAHMLVLHVTPYTLTSGHTHTTSHKNLQRNPNTHQPHTRHRKDCAEQEKPLTTIDTEKQHTNIIPSLPTHNLSMYPFILNCLHTSHNKAKVIR